MLQQHGMSDEHAATVVEALRIAFGAGPAQVAAQVAASPFVVKVEAGAGTEAAAAAAAAPAMASLFAAGGSFPSPGASAFVNASQGQTQEELEQSRMEAQKLEAQRLEAQRLEWEQGRADALTSVKQRLDTQCLKHGAAAARPVSNRRSVSEWWPISEWTIPSGSVSPGRRPRNGSADSFYPTP
jgi:hypothetical protein